MSKSSSRKPKTDPTRRQIRSMCEAIRSNWSDRTHLLRAGWTPDAADKATHWIVPLIRVADIIPIEDEIPVEE